MSTFNPNEPIEPEQEPIEPNSEASIDAEIDLYSTPSLQERYGIGKTSVNERMKALKLGRVRNGSKTFVRLEDVERLDELHAFMKEGGKLANFPGVIDVRTKKKSAPAPQPVEASEPAEPSEPTEPPRGKLIQSTWGLLTTPVESITLTILSSIKESFAAIPARRGRLTHLEDLERAYRFGWELSTSEIADLLDLNASTITSYGNEFYDRGFCFTRSGRCKGGQISWTVWKNKKAHLFSESNQAEPT